MRKDNVAKAFAVLLFLPVGAKAQLRESVPDAKTPTIQVIGSGTVQAKPDIATINIGVTTEDASAQSAVARNSAATAKVIAEVEAASVDKKDIRTSNFAVYPQYRTEAETKRQVVTYHVSNTVTVTIRELDRIGDILTKVVAAGSNQISGPNFAVSDPEKYLKEARAKAVQNALAKANIYANAAGLKLGAILTIAEEGAAAPVYAARPVGFAKAAAPVPVEAGEEKLQAQIALIVELKP
jgi:uncharacterized protein